MKVEANKSFLKSIKRLGSFGSKVREIRCWFRYHVFNKDFSKLHKTVMKSYPWDFGYLYDLERAKIEEMCKYHEKHQRFEGWEYVVRDMKLCMKLIDIFKGEVNLFHYNGNLNFVPIEGSDNYEVKESDDFKYVCDVRVNTKNVNRFCDSEYDKKWFIEHPHELYVKKAKCLYHKIRIEKDEYWWD